MDVKDVSQLWSTCSLLQHCSMASAFCQNGDLPAQLPPLIQGNAQPLLSLWETKAIFRLRQKPGSARLWRIPFEDLKANQHLTVEYDDYGISGIVTGFVSPAIEVRGDCWFSDNDVLKPNCDFVPTLDILLPASPTHCPSMHDIVSVLDSAANLTIDAQDIDFDNTFVEVHTGARDLCAHYKYKGDIEMMSHVLRYAQSVHSLCGFQPFSSLERPYGTLQLLVEHQNEFPFCMADDEISWGLGYM